MAHEPISFPVRCTHCQAEMDSPMVCESCNSLQPIGPDAEAFELLQLVPTFAIDLEQLENVYLRLSRMVHPDYFGKTGGPEKLLSEDLSARLNNAYRTLADPLTRSEYLLARAGGPAASDDKRVPSELLIEVMATRERIEQARAAGQDDALARLSRELSARVDGQFEQLGMLHAALEAAQAGGDESAVAHLLPRIRLTLNGVRYLQNLVRESRR